MAGALGCDPYRHPRGCSYAVAWQFTTADARIKLRHLYPN